MQKKNESKPELADIFRKYGEDYRRSHFLSTEQSKTMYHIEICRTALLGGHTEACDHCGFKKNAYNSCRDRHCPKCQTLVKEKWLDARKSELLPCPYFHNVFTLPHELNPLILSNKKIMLAMLFGAAKETLQVLECHFFPYRRATHSGDLLGSLALFRFCTHGTRNLWITSIYIALSRQMYSHLIRQNGLLPGTSIFSGWNLWLKNSEKDI